MPCKHRKPHENTKQTKQVVPGFHCILVDFNTFTLDNRALRIETVEGNEVKTAHRTSYLVVFEGSRYFGKEINRTPSK